MAATKTKRRDPNEIGGPEQAAHHMKVRLRRAIRYHKKQIDEHEATIARLNAEGAAFFSQPTAARPN